MSILSRLANVFRTRSLDSDLDEELRFHLDERIEQLIAGGMDPVTAAERARRRFGNHLRLRESSQDVKVLRGLESLLQDVRFGGRMLWKDRGAMAAAVVSLALALGACSTAFSLIDALILRPLPVPHPEQLFYLSYPDALTNAQPGMRREHDSFSYPQYQSFRQAAGRNLDLFAVNLSGSLSPAVFGTGEEEPVRVEGISASGFETLGVTPAVGRLFNSSDDSAESGLAVLSQAFWARRFGSDPAVLGSSVDVGGHHLRIIGITRPGFTGLRPGYATDVWIPLTAGVDARILASTSATWLGIWGRTKPGRYGEEALKAAWSNFRRDHADGAVLPPFASNRQRADYLHTPLLIHRGAQGADSLFRSQFAHPLWIFGIFSALLLLIATTNVANLLIARSVSREREMALRIALGAGRRRVGRQLLVESALLAVVSCSVGIGLGAAAAPFLSAHLGASNFPAWLDVRVEWRLLGVMTLLGALATLFFGAVPAFRASAVNPGDALKSSAKQSGALTALRPLLPIQVAFSFMVLFFSGLLLLSFDRLTRIDLGFAPEKVLLFNLSAKAANSTAQARLLDRIRSVAGVDSAALSQQAPIGGAFAFVMTPSIRFPGRAFEPVRPVQALVSPDFFHTMRISLLEGREFETRDSQVSVVVNDAFIKHYLAGRRAIGQRFEQIGDDKPAQLEIIGVVANSLFNNLREPIRPMMYTPLGSLNGAALEVRTVGDPRLLASTLRREIEADPAVHVRESMLQATRIANTLVSERLLAWLAAFFAIAALLLAAVGLHGVIDYFVGRRTKEIGIRMALGAGQLTVLRLIVRDVALLIGLGVVAGVAGGLALSVYARSLLFEVKPTDFRSLATPLVCLLAASVLASLRPALRAVRLDPVETLRYE